MSRQLEEVRQFLNKLLAREQAARAEAEAANQQLQNIFRQAPAAMVLFHGPEHRFVLANPLALEVLHRQEEDLLGKTAREVFPEIERQGYFDLLDQVYQTGEPFVGKEMKVQFHHPTGIQEHFFNFVYQPIYNASGEVEGILNHAVEVTEQVQSRQQMREFLSLATHELKTPLTTINGSLFLVRRRIARAARELPTDSPFQPILAELQSLLEPAERQSRIQNQLINDLLESARIQTDQFTISPEHCDLNSLVCEAVEDQRFVAPNRDLLLKIDSSEPLPVLADGNRIKQVISNYLTNALKCSEVQCPVTIQLLKDEQTSRVLVHDEGPGLTSEEQKHIWGRFYRVQHPDKQDNSNIGLGLGLYICRMIIEQHAGQVGVDSIPGIGSTFWFTLPIVDPK